MLKDNQLGRVAQQLREYQQAREYYQQALDIKIEYNDRYEQGRTLHNLGNVAQELSEYQQAGEYYQQALDIKIEYGDRYSQASSYFQLGKVAEELEELEQAKSYYLKDLEFTAESNDEHGLNITLSNLARFYQKTYLVSLLLDRFEFVDPKHHLDIHLTNLQVYELEMLVILRSLFSS